VGYAAESTLRDTEALTVISSKPVPQMLMMTHIPSAFFCLLLTSVAAAQSFFIPDSGTTPSWGPNALPFGPVRSVKYQQMVTVAELGGANKAGLICDLAFVPDVFGIRHFDTIQITLAQTKFKKLTTHFASNLGTNVKTVLKATNYEWHNSVANRWYRIGLDMGYPYRASNGNLVVHMQFTGTSLKTTSKRFPGFLNSKRQRVMAYNWTGSPPAIGSEDLQALKIEVLFGMNDTQAFGLGCLGSNKKTPELSFSGSAKLGASLSMNLKNALPTAALLHVIGLTRLEPEIDLQLIGAKGCRLYESVDVLIGGATDKTGAFARQVTVPNNTSIIGARLYTQFFPSDRQANTWGSTASNYGRILVGK
jgi:hypothetical protein